MKKRCTKCRREKEVNRDNFRYSIKFKDNYNSRCNECLNEYNRVNNKKISDNYNWSKIFLG
jgi:hypothetical protein